MQSAVSDVLYILFCNSTTKILTILTLKHICKLCAPFFREVNHATATAGVPRTQVFKPSYVYGWQEQQTYIMMCHVIWWKNLNAFQAWMNLQHDWRCCSSISCVMNCFCFSFGYFCVGNVLHADVLRKMSTCCAFEKKPRIMSPLLRH